MCIQIYRVPPVCPALFQGCRTCIVRCVPSMKLLHHTSAQVFFLLETNAWSTEQAKCMDTVCVILKTVICSFLCFFNKSEIHQVMLRGNAYQIYRI